jgi:hypothetical protein
MNIRIAAGRREQNEYKMSNPLHIKIEAALCPDCPFYNECKDEGSYCKLQPNLHFSYSKQIIIGGECPITNGVQVKVIK